MNRILILSIAFKRIGDILFTQFLLLLIIFVGLGGVLALVYGLSTDDGTATLRDKFLALLLALLILVIVRFIAQFFKSLLCDMKNSFGDLYNAFLQNQTATHLMQSGENRLLLFFGPLYFLFCLALYYGCYLQLDVMKIDTSKILLARWQIVLIILLMLGIVNLPPRKKIN